MYKSCKENIKGSASHTDLNSATAVLPKIGDVEYKVLSHIVNNILPSRKTFRNEEIWKALGLRKDTTSHVLRQLAEKGFLIKIAAGFYEVAEKIIDFMSNEPSVSRISEGKRGARDLNSSQTSISGTFLPDQLSRVQRGLPSGAGSDYFVFLDNLRGVSVSGNYVFGDRNHKLSLIDAFLNMDRIDYAEFGVGRRVSSVSDAVLPGFVVFYSNPAIQEIYFEFRPYSGVIPRDERGSLDLGSGVRMTWSILLRTFIELYRALNSKRAPSWVRNLADRLLTKMCRHATEL